MKIWEKVVGYRPNDVTTQHPYRKLLVNKA